MYQVKVVVYSWHFLFDMKLHTLFYISGVRNKNHFHNKDKTQTFRFVSVSNEFHYHLMRVRGIHVTFVYRH